MGAQKKFRKEIKPHSSNHSINSFTHPPRQFGPMPLSPPLHAGERTNDCNVACLPSPNSRLLQVTHSDKILADTDDLEPADFAALAISVVVPMGVAHCACRSQCWVLAQLSMQHQGFCWLAGNVLTIVSSRFEVDDRYGRGGESNVWHRLEWLITFHKTCKMKTKHSNDKMDAWSQKPNLDESWSLGPTHYGTKTTKIWTFISHFLDNEICLFQHIKLEEIGQSLVLLLYG